MTVRAAFAVAAALAGCKKKTDQCNAFIAHATAAAKGDGAKLIGSVNVCCTRRE